MLHSPLFSVGLSGPNECRPTLVSTLAYNPDSAFTWLPPDEAAQLNLPTYRERLACAPGADTMLTVQTLIVRVAIGLFHGVDEIIVAPHDHMKCLSRRTLSAMNARVEEVIRNLDPVRRIPQPVRRNYILVPTQPSEPFVALYQRAIVGASIPEDVRSPLKCDSLARTALVTRFLISWLAQHGEVTPERLADGLFLVLSRLLRCGHAAVMMRSPRSGLWNVLRQTPDLPRGRALSAAHDSPHAIPEIEAVGGALNWVFPSDRRIFQMEGGIGCYVEAESSEQHHFLKQLFRVIGPFIDGFLMQGDLTRALWESRDDARTLLAFPRNREDHVSYPLLAQAKRVLPDWTHLSLWRTSRTSRSLEKTAEHQLQPRKFQADRIVSWQDLPVSDRGHVEPDESAQHSVPAMLIFAFPENEGSERTVRSLVRRFSAGRTPFRFAYNSEQHAMFQVVVLSDAAVPPTVVLPDIEKRSTWVQAVEDNTQRLLRSLSLTGSELVITLWTHPYPRATRESDPPESFHLLVSLVAENSDVSRVNSSALAALRRALILRHQDYSVLSWSRYRLREVGNFLTGIYSAPHLDALGERIQESLGALLHTTSYLVIERPSGRVVLAASHLVHWQGRIVSVPELPQGEGRWFRNLSMESGQGCAELAETVLASLPPDVRNSKPPVPTQTLAVGAIYAAISDSLALLVIQWGWNGWKISSTEYSSVRVLSAALILAKPLTERSRPRENRGYDWSNRRRAFLMSKQNDVPTALDSLLGRLAKDLAKLSPCFATSAGTLFGVDGEEHFCRVIAGGPKEGAIPLQSSSMVAHALAHYHKDGREFTTFLGRVNKSGEGITLVSKELKSSGQNVAFHQLVSGQCGDLMAVRGFTRSNRLPMGFLVVRLGPCIAIGTTRALAKACALVEAAADEAALVLQRQIELRASEVRLALVSPLHRLRNAQVATLSKLSELESESQKSTRHLPAPLRRIFTAAYCASLDDILKTTLDSTEVLSISCRLRYPGPDGWDRIWRLSSVGDAEFRDAYEYDPTANVHSWVCNDTSEEIEDDSDDKLRRVFLPNVRDSALTRALYTGIHYQEDNPQTEAELCFGFGIRGRESHRVSFNVEGPRFFDLWLLEEYFRQMATTLAAEVALHYRRVEAADRSGIDLGTMFLRSLDHSVQRALPPPTEMASHERVPDALRRVYLETKIAESLSQFTANAPSVSSLTAALERGIAEFLTYSHNASVEVADTTTKECTELPVSNALELVLVKLLIEQTATLEKISPPEKAPHFLICRRISHDRRHIIVDIFNDTPPQREESRRLADALFWYEIDLETREAKGRSGRGLYLLGHMLRLIGCRPAMQRQPTPAAVKSYPSPLRERIRSEMTGLAIELHFRL